MHNTKIHKCKVYNIALNNLNRTISGLDLCILVTHYCNFSKSKGHNSAENYLTGPKFDPNLHILVTHLYTEFQFKMSICNWNNKRKLKIHGIFLSPRGITLPKIIPLNFNSNSTCIFSWQTCVPNFIWIYLHDNERKLNPEWRKDVMTETGNTIIMPRPCYGGDIKTYITHKCFTTISYITHKCIFTTDFLHKTRSIRYSVRDTHLMESGP